MISAAGTSGDGIGGWCSARIVPCSAGVASTSPSQPSWSSVISPWCQPGTLVSRLTIRSPATSYTRSCGCVGLLAEQLAGVRRPLVVVAHAPHDLGADPVGVRLDQVAQRAVGVGLPEVGEVAGEHERLRRRIDPRQPVERRAEARDGVDRAVLPGVAGQEVGVAHVGDDVGGWGELAELDHESSVRRLHRPVATRRTARWGAACDPTREATMNKAVLNSMTDAERRLVAETEPAATRSRSTRTSCSSCSSRIRRARSKYVKNYRRAAGAKVGARSSRGTAYAENQRDRDKAEVFELALARVSRQVGQGGRAGGGGAEGRAARRGPWLPAAAPVAAKAASGVGESDPGHSRSEARPRRRAGQEGRVEPGPGRASPGTTGLALTAPHGRQADG